MTARMRRLLSDCEQVTKDFTGHKHIVVTPIGDDLPEQYHVTYFVNGIYLLPDGTVQTLGRHEVEITLHADYPRYKPICRILTPIWHPNFRDDQVCIGDIWGAGESLSDIIINIGDMIQYKSWNASSPLSAEAARWAIANRHLFPVGNAELYASGSAPAAEAVEIDLWDDFSTTASLPLKPPVPENDFEITPEELAGITFIPTAQKMQQISQAAKVKGKVNFKTVLIKGLLWAFLGALIGFLAAEPVQNTSGGYTVACYLSGHPELTDYCAFTLKADEASAKIEAELRKWCDTNGRDYNDEDAAVDFFLSDDIPSIVDYYLDEYTKYDELATDEIYDAYLNDYNEDEDQMMTAVNSVLRVHTGLWAAVIALCIGLFLGIGEGVYYGSGRKALRYGLIGAGISLGIGFASGLCAQWMYGTLLTDNPDAFTAALVRGLGWSIMGVGIGVAAGLIKPSGKRILFCTLGGLVGSFIGGFLFNFVFELIPNELAARGVAIVIMGILIGVGVGLLEQFAKVAWLKVIRGEFEGKEYLVFAGITSIGNHGGNTIVLFKDKLVAPRHCEIRLEGRTYVLTDCGTPMGTIVNGQRTNRHILHQGDTITVGNSVLIFNAK